LKHEKKQARCALELGGEGSGNGWWLRLTSNTCASLGETRGGRCGSEKSRLRSLGLVFPWAHQGRSDGCSRWDVVSDGVGCEVGLEWDLGLVATLGLTLTTYWSCNRPTFLRPKFQPGAQHQPSYFPAWRGSRRLDEATSAQR
jgi:hypothetical protein